MSSKHCTLPALAIALMLPATAMAQSVGSATWYGNRGSGAHTASGERFDEEAMTAASNRLPLGARVRVTMDDGQSVVVRVNDRMGSRSTFIDLTKGAARQIGLLGRGRATVSIAAAADEPLEVAEATEDERTTRATQSAARHVVRDVCTAPADRPRRAVRAVGRRL